MRESDSSIPSPEELEENPKHKSQEEGVEETISDNGEKVPKKIPKHVYFLIALAIIMTSFASILIRFSGRNATQIGIVPAEASVIAFWRLLFATVGMFLGAVFSRNLKEFKKVQLKRDVPLLTLSGLALAVHFVTWNLSLEMTDVASSIVILDIMPIFTLLLSIIFLRERISWAQLGAMILTIGGAIIVGVSDWTKGITNLYGDLFALAGSISVAAYFVIGRKTREKLDIFSYATLVYAVCTIFLLIYNLALGSPMIAGLSWLHFLFFILLALGPSCLGHTLYNYSLGFLKAPVVTIVALGEMFGASILAFALFKEKPLWWAFIGMVLVVVGIVLTVLLENKAIKEQMAATPAINSVEESTGNVTKELALTKSEGTEVERGGKSGE